MKYFQISNNKIILTKDGREMLSKNKLSFDNFIMLVIKKDKQQGRFPSNVILECACRDDELMRGAAKSGGGRTLRGKTMFTDSKDGSAYFNYGDKNGNEECYVHTNPDCVCKQLDEQAGESRSVSRHPRHAKNTDYGVYGNGLGQMTGPEYDDIGGRSRFFYQAKASQNERWFYCTKCSKAYSMKQRDNHIHDAPANKKYEYIVFHPTVKPLALIEYLIRLVTPPDGTVLDPFAGTGTLLIAAEHEGFNSVNIDSNLEYCKIAYTRGKEEGNRRLLNDVDIEKVNF